MVDDEVSNLKLVPMPFQGPHPPIWLMVSSERTARLAAERDYNTIAAGTATAVLKEFVDVYAGIRSDVDGREYARGEGWAVSRPVHVSTNHGRGP